MFLDDFLPASLIYIIFANFVLILIRKRLSNVALAHPVGHNNENSAMNFYCTGRLTAIFSLNV